MQILTQHNHYILKGEYEEMGPNVVTQKVGL